MVKVPVHVKDFAAGAGAVIVLPFGTRCRTLALDALPGDCPMPMDGSHRARPITRSAAGVVPPVTRSAADLVPPVTCSPRSGPERLFRWFPARLIAGGLVAAMLACPAPARGQEAVYHPFGALTGELEDLVNGSNRATMRSLGTSGEGREIWLVEISGPGSAPADLRPAVLVVANLEADHLIGSQLALGIVRHLIEDRGMEDSALEDRLVYVVPRLNPDGAERFFGAVLADGSRTNRPVDDDNDGRFDEDPPEDLNGDGLITVMRVPDPLGRYVIDDDDPRLMREARPSDGRAGAYSIYWEGVDSDGDGFLNEDGLGGVDLNRNFQHAYPYYTPDAGPHMVSEPESRALMDFVVSHRNIAAILTFGLSDNLVVPPRDNGTLAPESVLELPAFADASNDAVFDVGNYAAGTAGGLQLRGVQPGADNNPESGRRPEVNVHADDVPYFAAVSEAYREVTGIEKVGLNRTPEGAFFQYGYFQYGVPSFSTPGWALPEPETEAEDAPSGFESEMIRALESIGVEPFVDWSPFDHPEMGAVEIGGFRPYALTNPPPDQIPDLGRAHGEFVVRLAGMLPRISIVSTEVESHGGGLFTVSVEVENAGYLPSALRHGVVAGSVDPVTVQIDVLPEEIVTGDAKTSQVPRIDGSGSRVRFEWVIRGSQGANVEIRARAQKGGTDVATVQLGGE